MKKFESMNVSETLPDNPDASKAGRSWTFANAAQAEKHAAQFSDVPAFVAFVGERKAARDADSGKVEP